MVYQTTDVTCAAASAANILSSWRIVKTEKQMAEQLETKIGAGTSAAQAIYGLRKMGIACKKILWSPKQLANSPQPVMLFIDHPLVGKEGHAVTFMKMKEKRYVIWDPLIGKQQMTLQKLQKYWHGRGVLCQKPLTGKVSSK